MPTETATGLDPDPCGLIAAFLLVPAPGDSADSVYVAWLVSLAAALDPARAAGLLLARLDLAERPPLPEADRLVAMLDETTRWPRHRLDQLPRRRSRRDR